MGAPWPLVKSFIREATEDANFAPVADIATAYAKLRAIQRGAYDTVKAESGLVQIHSKIGENEFAFQIPEGLSPADIMMTAETALEVIAGKTVAQARALLVRVKRRTPAYDCLRL